MKKFTFEIRRVIEYSEFFVGNPPIDIRSTLKLFSRSTLVRMATILSHHYGNMCVPDKERTLFSESSKKHIPYLNKLFKAYYNRLGLHPNQRFRLQHIEQALSFGGRFLQFRQTNSLMKWMQKTKKYCFLR